MFWVVGGTYDVHFGRECLCVSLRNKGVVAGIMNGGALNIQAVIPVECKAQNDDEKLRMCEIKMFVYLCTVCKV